MCLDLLGRTVILLLNYEICGGVAARRVLFGAAVALTGQEVRVRLLLRITRATSITSLLKSLSGEVVSHFLEDWELGRVALSCHTAVDLLCQEMRGACWVSSRSRGSPLSLCSLCQSSSLVKLSQQEALNMNGLWP